MNEHNLPTDAQIADGLKKYNAAAAKGRTVGMIGFLPLAGGTILSLEANFGSRMISLRILGLVFIGIGILLIAIGRGKSSAVNEAARVFVRENLLVSVLGDLFEQVDYQANFCLPDGRIAASKLGLADFQIPSGGDYIRAKYRGHALEMCNLALRQTGYRTFGGGHVTKTEYEVFKGQWMCCDLGGAWAADTLLRERKTKIREQQAWGDTADNLVAVETPNAVFNKRFTVKSDDPAAALALLTPQMTDYITELDEMCGGDICMRFSADGKIYIAIDSGRDILAIKPIVTAADVPALRAGFENELRGFALFLERLMPLAGL